MPNQPETGRALAAEEILPRIIAELVAIGSSHNMTARRGIYLIPDRDLSKQELEQSLSRAFEDPANPQRPDCAVAMQLTSSFIPFLRLRLTEAGFKQVPIDESVVERRLLAEPTIRLVPALNYYPRLSEFLLHRKNILKRVTAGRNCAAL
jgi:hypothetical protein